MTTEYTAVGLFIFCPQVMDGLLNPSRIRCCCVWVWTHNFQSELTLGQTKGIPMIASNASWRHFIELRR